MERVSRFEEMMLAWDWREGLVIHILGVRINLVANIFPGTRFLVGKRTMMVRGRTGLDLLLERRESALVGRGVDGIVRGFLFGPVRGMPFLSVFVFSGCPFFPWLLLVVVVFTRVGWLHVKLLEGL